MNHAALKDFILDWEAQTFRYGRSDCAIFVIDALEKIFGHKLSTKLKKWSNKKEADRALEAHGGGVEEAAAMVAQLEGLEALSKPLVRAGDVCVVDVGGRVALGIMENAADAVCLSPKGLVRVPKQLVLRGWRVSHA